LQELEAATFSFFPHSRLEKLAQPSMYINKEAGKNSASFFPDIDWK